MFNVHGPEVHSRQFFRREDLFIKQTVSCNICIGQSILLFILNYDYNFFQTQGNSFFPQLFSYWFISHSCIYIYTYIYMKYTEWLCRCFPTASSGLSCWSWHRACGGQIWGRGEGRAAPIVFFPRKQTCKGSWWQNCTILPLLLKLGKIAKIAGYLCISLSLMGKQSHTFQILLQDFLSWRHMMGSLLCRDIYCRRALCRLHNLLFDF